MNIINNLTSFFKDRNELMKIQEANDLKMEKLDCKDVIASFIFYERKRTREQINEGSKLGLFDMINFMKQSNELNKQNLELINKILNLENPCEKINEIVKYEYKNYSECFKKASAELIR